MARTGWIGVDLDGTLAKYDGQWRGPDHIGEPIAPMVERVRQWLAIGQEVRIFTARVYGAVEDVRRAREAIKRWCRENIGAELEVTCQKDYSMIALWDDRAIQVETNTGRLIGDGSKAP